MFYQMCKAVCRGAFVGTSGTYGDTEYTGTYTMVLYIHQA